MTWHLMSAHFALPCDDFLDCSAYSCLTESPGLILYDSSRIILTLRYIFAIDLLYCNARPCRDLEMSDGNDKHAAIIAALCNRLRPHSNQIEFGVIKGTVPALTQKVSIIQRYWQSMDYRHQFSPCLSPGGCGCAIPRLSINHSVNRSASNLCVKLPDRSIQTTDPAKSSKSWQACQDVLICIS